MTIQPEPGLLDCMAMVQRDHKAKTACLYCAKHGTMVYWTPLNEVGLWTNKELLPLWRARSCRDQD